MKSPAGRLIIHGEKFTDGAGTAAASKLRVNWMAMQNASQLKSAWMTA